MNTIRKYKNIVSRNISEKERKEIEKVMDEKHETVDSTLSSEDIEEIVKRIQKEHEEKHG